jgi:hypothetical protein
MGRKVKNAKIGITVRVQGKLAVPLIKLAVESRRTVAQQVNWALAVYLSSVDVIGSDK